MFRGLTDFLLTDLVKQGTTVQSLKHAEFEVQPFPLPPLAEQRRIVAKVEELMALLDWLEPARSSHETARAAIDLAREKFIRAESATTSMRNELEKVETELGPTESRESIHDTKSKAVRDAEAALMDAATKNEALRAIAPDLEALEAATNRAASAVERARQEVETLERELAALHAETPASVCFLVPWNTSCFSWCSPLFRGKSNGGSTSSQV